MGRSESGTGVDVNLDNIEMTTLEQLQADILKLRKYRRNIRRAYKQLMQNHEMYKRMYMTELCRRRLLQNEIAAMRLGLSRVVPDNEGKEH